MFSIGSKQIVNIARFLGVVLVSLALLEGLDFYRAIGLVLPREQLSAVILGLALAIIFIFKPFYGREDKKKLPLYDCIFAVISLFICFYIAIHWLELIDTLFEKPYTSTIISVLLISTIAECLRRAVGMMLFLLFVFFIILGLLGHLIPGNLQGNKVAIDRMFLYVALDPNSIIGLPIGIVVSIVIAFIFFGNLLNESGGSKFFTELSTSLMGKYRGGSAKISIIASSLFGSISGSAVSNVVSTGVITIPMMKKGGYPSEKAGAIEAAASTGGQLMPPMMGAAGFLLAEFLEVPFKDVIFAALIPAILYYIALFIQVDLYAAKENISALSNNKYKFSTVFKQGWPYIFPFTVIIISLFYFNLRPQTSVINATVFTIPIALFYGYGGSKMHWKKIITALSKTGIIVTQLIMIACMAGAIIGILNITGLGFALTGAIIQLSGGNITIILLLTGAISIILGMGMPTVGVYLLLVTLVIPSMVEAGIPPFTAHMFALYFGILSMITPPVAAASFAAATVAKSDFIKTAFVSISFGWPAYIVPFIFVGSPAMLWQGTAFEITRIFILSILGVWAISVGWIGYIAGNLNKLWRLVLIFIGIICLLPPSATMLGDLLDIIAILSLTLTLFIRYILVKKRG